MFRRTWFTFRLKYCTKAHKHLCVFLAWRWPTWVEKCSFKKHQKLSWVVVYMLAYSMEQSSSWEANRFLASQEIPCILWNPKVLCRNHKSPPPVPILSQIDPVHDPNPLPKIHFNIILLSTPVSPKWSLSLTFAHQSPIGYILIPPNAQLWCYLRPSFGFW